MADRHEFLKSRLETKENIFNLSIPIRPNHRIIFDRLAENFRPAAKLTDDIKELVTRPDFNLCRDKSALIFYQGDGLKLNTLKFYLTMNFLANWKEYKNYVSNIVSNDFNNSFNLTINSASLEYITELRFRNENNEVLSNIYSVDILYLTVNSSSSLFNSDFYKDLFRTIVSIRSNQKLVTVIIFIGTEKTFKDQKFDTRLTEVSIKSYNLTGVKNKVNREARSVRKTSTLNFNEEEDI